MKDRTRASRALRMATRDPTRTRDRILDAALEEFSARGFSGARVEAIARRAPVNKRMLYHYFGDKKSLFREVLRKKMAQRAAWREGSPAEPSELLPYWFDHGCHDLNWIRLLQWEALQGGGDEVIDEAARREALARAIERTRRRKELGLLPGQLDSAYLLLGLMALTMFPLAFPQLTRLLTGLPTTAHRFQRGYGRFLRGFALAIQPRPRSRKFRKSSLTMPLAGVKSR